MEEPTWIDLVEHGDISLTRWEDDELALRQAARNGRHPYNYLTDLEERCFADISSDITTKKVFLFIRNKILQHWDMEPNVEVTWENVAQNMCEPFNKQLDLIRRCLLFLTRYGYINYGLFHRLTAVPTLRRPLHVVIVGAGISGIMAARQLISFGAHVTVLESNIRVGGRLHTKNSSITIPTISTQKIIPKVNKIGIDLGADTMTGLPGNPLYAIMKQINCHPLKLSNNLQIYDETGKLVETKKVHIIEGIYKKFAAAIGYLVNVKGKNTMDGEMLDCQTVFDILTKELEYDNKLRQEKYWENYLELQKKLAETGREMHCLERIAKTLEQKAVDMEELKENGGVNGMQSDLIYRFLYNDMVACVRLADNTRDRRETLQALLKDLKKNEPSSVYMNHKDRRLLDWFYAYAEAVLGTTLDQVSVEGFWPSIVEEFKNDTIAMKEGFNPFVSRLASNIDNLHVATTVNMISYDDQKVAIRLIRRQSLQHINGNDTNNEEGSMCIDSELVEDYIQADAVICTVPLGVLKKEAIKFVPPLSASKSDAIERMGFGTINKIVLIFDRQFWNSEQNFIGHLNANHDSKGEYFLFTSFGNKPYLTALMSGSSASVEQPNEVIVNNAMTVLKNIFGAATTPKLPKEAFITRWHNDRHSWGTTSFVALGATANMYDLLAQPIRTEKGPCRVFFAGEHTYRVAPNTVPGAFLSGVRAAAEVADQFIGMPFLKKGFDECIDLSDDDYGADDDVSVKAEGNDNN